jgi:hypothetical protein
MAVATSAPGLHADQTDADNAATVKRDRIRRIGVF